MARPRLPAHPVGGAACRLDSMLPEWTRGCKGTCGHRYIQAMPKKGTGPRGGKTTRHESGLVRKVYYLYEPEAEAIRRIAFERHVTESEVLREAVDLYLERIKGSS